MSQTVNFLPWRHHRRQRNTRRWVIIFTATALIIAILGLALHWLSISRLQRAAVWQHADETLLVALSAAEKPLQLRQQQWQQMQARWARRQNTQAWRQMLLALAEGLPTQAWLTRLRWHQNQLELSGMAGTFASLSELERRLHHMPGFRLPQPGVTERDAQGRWRFRYPLIRESVDVAEP